MMQHRALFHLILIIVFHAGGGICHKLVGKVLTKATGIWTEGHPSAPQCGRRRSQALYWFAGQGGALSPPAPRAH